MSTRPEQSAADDAAGQRGSRRSESRRVASWSEHHRWSAAASLRRLLARPFGTLMTVAVIGLALALPLAFYLLLGNVQRMGDALGQRSGAQGRPVRSGVSAGRPSCLSISSMKA